MTASRGSSIVIGSVMSAAASVAASTSISRATTPSGVISASSSPVGANGPTPSKAPAAPVVAQRRRNAPRSRTSMICIGADASRTTTSPPSAMRRAQ